MFEYRVTSVCKALVGLATILLSFDAHSRETVGFDPTIEPGTIVVRTSQRRLYFVLELGSAIRYRVAVGKRGKQWSGVSVIDGKYLKPAWIPPAEMKKANSRLPPIIPGGSRENPMGDAALTLSGDKYAIHGTNQPNSVGREASFGCIRMLNEDIVDLFERVKVGTTVMVTR